MKRCAIFLALVSPLALAAPDKGPAKPATPTESATSAELDAGVKMRIDVFFKFLKDGKVDEAYAKLFEGSTLAKEQPELLPTLVKNTTLIIEKCGKVESASLLRVRSAGRTLKEVIYIANCQKRPIRWQIYAYYGEGRWQILDTDVNLELDSFFEPEGKPAANR
jgi:hypothetical protein